MLALRAFKSLQRRFLQSHSLQSDATEARSSPKAWDLLSGHGVGDTQVYDVYKTCSDRITECIKSVHRADPLGACTHIGETTLLSTPKLTNLYHAPSMSTHE
jgi:hypothetical protein